MKIVIQTQHRENYAAHDEGYVHGVDAPHWKYKGGDTYVVKCSFSEAVDPAFREAAIASVTSSNEGFEEYVLDWEILDDAEFNIASHVESWESPTFLWMDGNNFVAHRTVKNDEMGYMRSEIAKKYESWTQSSGSREEYKCSFEMVTGEQVLYADLGEWLERKAA